MCCLLSITVYSFIQLQYITYIYRILFLCEWLESLSRSQWEILVYIFALKEIQEDRYADYWLSQFPSFCFTAFDGSDTFGTTISSTISSWLPGACIFDGRMAQRWCRVVDLSPFCPYIMKSCITSTWIVISCMNFILRHCKHGLENDWQTQIAHYTVKVHIQDQSMYKFKWNLRLKFYSVYKSCGYYDVNSKHMLFNTHFKLRWFILLLSPVHISESLFADLFNTLKSTDVSNGSQ